jgi:nitroreductase
MNLIETIQARQSVRAFLPTPIEPDKLEALLAAANQAPSAGNLQAYQIHLVQDEAVKRALVKASLEQGFIAQAPIALAFCAHPARAARYGKRGEDLYAVQDATIAVAYAQLAATALGLATCWVGAFDELEVSRLLALPSGQRPVAILPVGYAAETPERTARRALADLVTGWSKPA